MDLVELEKKQERDGLVMTNCINEEKRQGRKGRRTMEVETGSVHEEAGRRPKSLQVERCRGSMRVCLQPVRENWDHVYISLEEVEKYSRFSRYCHWLCGRCLMSSCCS